jgi:hypothetical protein
LRAFDVVRQWPGLDPRGIRVYAYGKQGVYAQLAAALDKRVQAIQVVGGIGSYAKFVAARRFDHRDIKSVVFPGILKYCDLPQIMRWIKASGISVS